MPQNGRLFTLKLADTVFLRKMPRFQKSVISRKLLEIYTILFFSQMRKKNEKKTSKILLKKYLIFSTSFSKSRKIMLPIPQNYSL